MILFGQSIQPLVRFCPPSFIPRSPSHPAWAKHEPTTPHASTSNLSHFIIASPSGARPSNLSVRPPLSHIQTGVESPSTPTSASHWWDSALARRKSSVDASGSGSLPKPERRLSLGLLRSSLAQRVFDKSSGAEEGIPSPPTLEIPPPERVFTVNQVRTPGWDTPWHPHVPSHSSHDNTEDDHSPYRRTLGKRNIRRFILHSNLTPLVSLLDDPPSVFLPKSIGRIVNPTPQFLIHHRYSRRGSQYPATRATS